MAESLREWLDQVEKMGELEKVNGADWKLEIGCLTAINWSRRKSPALLFDNIKGYPAGLRVVTSSTGTPSLVGLTLNLPGGYSGLPLVHMVAEKLSQWEKDLGYYRPKVVSTGPVQENILSGDAIDLLKFPVPLWHEEDGGRYIGTGDAVITRDMDTGQVNLGTYRVMVHDRKTLGIYMAPARHGENHILKYHSRGLPAPIAVSIGHHPLVFRMACFELPPGSEYENIGAIAREPVEVIQEETTGLPIPANSEAVLVGWSPPGKKRLEGPFGEFTGYYASGEVMSPIIEVERIYHRNDPIILGSPPGRPPSDSNYYQCLMCSANLHNDLVKAGVPDLVGVFFHEMALQQFITVAIKQRYAGHARQTALLASQLARGGSMNRYVMVVDEDIDPTNNNDVMWALSTRSDPEKDIDILRRTRSTPLDPIMRKPAEAYFNSRAIIDACKPYEWKDQFPKPVDFDPALARSLKEKFKTFAG
ncbi:MAG: UbiD family decarboxylase [Chloroflexi bacterium]|nr:UbiD family decarboxylase [Chloroflexota bacterium]